MDPLPSANAANTGSEVFEDPEDPDPTTHASIGAADGTAGSTDKSSSWESIRVPDSPATPRGGKVRAASAPGHHPDTARATGSAMDGPPHAAGYEPKPSDARFGGSFPTDA